MNRPFIIYALPRSRTFWLSRFLSYRDWTCYHQAAAHMRRINDIPEFFNQPKIGACETAAAPGWRIVRHHVPEIRMAVIRRPVDDVVYSVMHRMNSGGVATYNESELHRLMTREARDLAKISAQRGVLTLNFADLAHENACATLFQHCLPYGFDRAWWDSLKDANLQADIRGYLLYYFANRDAIEGFKRIAKSELRRMVRAKEYA